MQCVTGTDDIDASCAAKWDAWHKTKADLHARIYMNLHHDFISKHLAYDYFVHLELILNTYPSKAVDMMSPQLYEGGAAEPLPHSRGAAFQPSE